MRLLDGHPYTPAAKMGPDYLRERFKEIREQQERDSASTEIRKPSQVSETPNVRLVVAPAKPTGARGK